MSAALFGETRPAGVRDPDLHEPQAPIPEPTPVFRYPSGDGRHGARPLPSALHVTPRRQSCQGAGPGRGRSAVVGGRILRSKLAMKWAPMSPRFGAESLQGLRGKSPPVGVNVGGRRWVRGREGGRRAIMRPSFRTQHLEPRVFGASWARDEIEAVATQCGGELEVGEQACTSVAGRGGR